MSHILVYLIFALCLHFAIAIAKDKALSQQQEISPEKEYKFVCDVKTRCVKGSSCELHCKAGEANIEPEKPTKQQQSTATIDKEVEQIWTTMKTKMKSLTGENK